MRPVSKSSTYARLKLLKKSLQRPADAPIELGPACASQGAFAALSLPEHSVANLALNTLKETARVEVEDGGWEKLDKLRKKYFVVWSASNAATLNRKKPLKLSSAAEAARLKKLLDEADRARLCLVRAYLELLRIAKAGSVRDDQLRNEMEEHLACWRSQLGLPLASEKKSP